MGRVTIFESISGTSSVKDSSERDASNIEFNSIEDPDEFYFLKNRIKTGDVPIRGMEIVEITVNNG